MLGFHALNARDNTLLPWIFFELAGSDPAVFQRTMQAEARQIRDLLASRGVHYEDLRSALVPTTNGVQAVFLYDWLDEPSWNYAVAFSRDYLPCLRGDLRTSMLHGDLHNGQGAIPVDAFEGALVKPRTQPVNWQTQYAVYFSNLHPRDVARLHESLSKQPRYTGYVDVSFTCPARDFLPQTVTSHWVILGDKAILSHGGDEPLVSDEDLVGFDLPAHGYKVVSLLDAYFECFLSYKIEATDAYQAVNDRILSLAAITGELIDVESVEVFVHPDKLDKYLLRDENKLRLMTNIGLQDVTADELAAAIRTKLRKNYVYDFRFAPDGTPLFAVAAEFDKPNEGGLTRRLLALKHDETRGAISLVTMY
ncbi:hypothetical protein [Phytoactinopolyspora limicola]|uniref:hypothetical protein n=1 Tax=Phytoactinopolyspora limicola TaxID=2715536 RepID=UPI00140769ED|nr:hypothetical protein [Phytoactinopolyspora limicola]